MMSSFVRPALALALALGLSACGGKASFPITGTVTGLQYPGLVLSTNGQSVTVTPPTVGTASTVPFQFPNGIDYGEVYKIEATSLPAHQGCTLTSGTTDTAGRLEKINAKIDCFLATHTVGGTITGLNADGLVLVNGSLGGTYGPVAKDATTSAYPPGFTFATPVEYGKTYGVAVLTQPAGQTCTVSANGAGIMADANVTDITVTCVNNPT
jgi:hypothetical protein